MEILTGLGFRPPTIPVMPRELRLKIASEHYKTKKYIFNGDIVSVQILKQRSKTKCVLGGNIIWRKNELIVSGGCVAEVKVLIKAPVPKLVRTEKVNLSIKPVKREQPPGSYKVKLQSKDYKPLTAEFSRPIKDVQVEKQLSKTKCQKGITWGFSGNKLWVRSGCRAEFKVLFDAPASLLSLKQTAPTSTYTPPATPTVPSIPYGGGSSKRRGGIPLNTPVISTQPVAITPIQTYTQPQPQPQPQVQPQPQPQPATEVKIPLRTIAKPEEIQRVAYTYRCRIEGEYMICPKSVERQVYDELINIQNNYTRITFPPELSQEAIENIKRELMSTGQCVEKGGALYCYLKLQPFFQKLVNKYSQQTQAVPQEIAPQDYLFDYTQTQLQPQIQPTQQYIPLPSYMSDYGVSTVDNSLYSQPTSEGTYETISTENSRETKKEDNKSVILAAALLAAPLILDLLGGD